MENEQLSFEFEPKKVIKGYPELHWMGKRPYKSTQYYPAQLKETYGEKDETGWINKIFWGDNLQVMSHLLKDYRGRIKMIYIDPPFDSKADYKKKIQLKNQVLYNDNNTFEEKQYGDIWTNDEYLQFIYERIILIKELLADDGCIFVHCDYRRVHQIRAILDEIFGISTDANFRNEIIWAYRTGGAPKDKFLARKHDNILFYSKSSNFTINPMKERQYLEKPFMDSKIDSQGRYYVDTVLRDILDGVINIVEDSEKEEIVEYNTRAVLNLSAERVDYPTQKPLGLLKLLIKLTTKEGDLVFDCFMGSGTTQQAAMELRRRFIGADINLGAVQTTTKRLANILKEDNLAEKHTGFEVYNVNNYDLFRNPVEAKDLIIEALEIQKFDSSVIYDGEKDGRMVYIMPVNRIATRADLESLKANLPYKTWEKRKEENPTAPVERITLVCMGHESDLKATLQQDLANYKLDIEIIDLLRDKSQFTFKRDSEADIEIKNGKLIIKNFYPMGLLQKLSFQKEDVENWRQLVESVMIDFNYDGEVLNPEIIDIPNKNELVKGEYEIPAGAKRIKVKITDLLSESLEVEVK